ncbi:MAG: hypothetical protein Q4F35_03505 [Akkermansia sp.]|nr:hypothetical protein [Akkermansia sp.]
MGLSNIVRCNKEFDAFDGWRFCIVRHGVRLVRYFSDLRYGSSEAAEKSAREFRDFVFDSLGKLRGKEAGDILKRIDNEYRNESPIPQGLNRPRTSPHMSNTVTMRTNDTLRDILLKASRHLNVDASSVIRLALYSHMPQLLSQPASPSADELAKYIARLEEQARPAGLPTFSAFATGREE